MSILKAAKNPIVLTFRRRVLLPSNTEIFNQTSPHINTIRNQLTVQNQADTFYNISNDSLQLDNIRRASILKRKILEDLYIGEGRDISVTLIEQNFTNFDRCLYIIKIENGKSMALNKPLANNTAKHEHSTLDDKYMTFKL